MIPRGKISLAGRHRSWFPSVTWICLILVALISLALVAVPVWVIQPFRPQSQRGLVWSFEMRRWATLVTPVALLVGLGLIWQIWRMSIRWWAKTLAIVFLIPLVVSMWFSRQNHFEWMFNPLPNPAYAKTADVEFVDNSDVVMAIESNGEAVAYPVRLMAYHHLVHDSVGGTPLVATY